MRTSEVPGVSYGEARATGLFRQPGGLGGLGEDRLLPLKGPKGRPRCLSEGLLHDRECWSRRTSPVLFLLFLVQNCPEIGVPGGPPWLSPTPTFRTFPPPFPFRTLQREGAHRSRLCFCSSRPCISPPANRIAEQKLCTD